MEIFTLWEEDNLEISVTEGFYFLVQRNFGRIRKSSTERHEQMIKLRSGKSRKRSRQCPRPEQEGDE